MALFSHVLFIGYIAKQTVKLADRTIPLILKEKTSIWPISTRQNLVSLP